jgi:hypothetical protein
MSHHISDKGSIPFSSTSRRLKPRERMPCAQTQSVR